MTRDITTVQDAKAAAKRLRAELSSKGMSIGHSEALERLSQQHGYHDWNAFCAHLDDAPPATWVVGGRVSGRFRGQAFKAHLLSISRVRSGWYTVSLKFDEAVDVVTFESFSNLRHRVTGTVGPQGTSQEKTSDGVPHLSLDR